MKPFKTLLTILFISLLSSPSWSVTIDDLVKREGIYYEKFTDVPFTGKVTDKLTGSDQTTFKNGKRDGAWIGYHENGQLWWKGNYRNGKREGAYVQYHENGQFSVKGNYKNDERKGLWVSYHKTGQLHFKGNYQDGKRNGTWVSYHVDGTVNTEFTGKFYNMPSGTYKDGVKISD